MDLSYDTLTSLALAVGLGLLIGMDRERRKGSGPTRHFAGIRTFTLVSLAGAVAQLLAQPWITLVAAVLVAALAVISHLKDRSKDPGVTTEIALFVTFMLGVLTVDHPVVAAAGGVVVAGLLAARAPLRRFSIHTLSELELRDALVLAGAALVILPLAPNVPLAWMGGVNPRTVWLLVVLIMGVQSVGHIGLRLLGSQLGLPLSGLVAGFVSSTATIAAMGARARRQPEVRMACIAAAWFSTVATSLQISLIALALQPSALRSLGPAMGCALATALVLGLATLWRSERLADDGQVKGRAFSLLQSIGLALLLSAITAAVAWVQGAFGAMATYAVTALAGFADAHSAAAAAITLSAHGSTDPATMLTAVLLAFSTNTVSKSIAAYVAGGARFGTTISLGLVVVVAAAWLPWGWERVLFQPDDYLTRSKDAYMSLQVLWHWLPNLFVVVLVAFPAFFLIHRHVIRRLAAGAISALAFLFFFGTALEPPFSFTRMENFPPLVLGLVLGWLLAKGGRALRKNLSNGRTS